jgi:hypothetical protein
VTPAQAPTPVQGQPPRPTLCRGQGCGVQVVFLPSQASGGERFVCATLPGVKMFVMVRRDDPGVQLLAELLADERTAAALPDNLEARARVLVEEARPGLVLADQAAIDTGEALARQVTVYGSHHAGYNPIPACTQAASFRRGSSRAASSPTTATRSPR